MLKLIIADDERVIRETISTLIDWNELGIELVGLCKDGIEAYNMILDEAPDIVMTDIRMPGLSGLELARKITQTDQQIQFIFLSGYEEFDYAREAMEYGVRHYLLKPCSEEKLLESIRRASEDCLRAKRQMEERLRQSEMLRIIRQDAMYHLILDGIALEDAEDGGIARRMREQMEAYGKYQDFDRSPCYLYYVYFLEWQYLEEILENLEARERKSGESFAFYGVYVKNTLLLFSYDDMGKEILGQCLGGAGAMVEIARERYEHLPELLEHVLRKVKRYDTIYAIHNFRPIAILNNQSAMQYMQNIYQELEGTEKEQKTKALEELLAMVREASRLESLQMLGNSICTQLAHMGLRTMSEMTCFFRIAGQEKDMEKLREQIMEMLTQAMTEVSERKQECGGLSERVMDYVEKHLSDPDLTLKKIAEEYLYMNVDYVSRQFRKSTGKKFSQYLTEQRVRRAKELLAEEGGNKIQYVAERVGCGNNPQYFSQIFKKIEGVTPGKWAAQFRA
ncbi:MAG: response regulator [Eubacteriales bacterium]|nr:response regulator [Eubacteriales bacterium]